ncbi:isoleucyl-tRNA synthetase [Pedobacter gandavensis]|uniref:isoleucyl-tRNA synthetase n=1 Tax=Pedobacter gandavensis TaxID=2679963 RepID=UPI00292FA16A|nr:isoleucyl-tRNA synthetase [Pedobacter gandavensis]
MIKVMKLQKAVYAIILGVIALVVYIIMATTDQLGSRYALEVSGVFFMAAAILFLYPLWTAKEDELGRVELDPEKQEEMDIAQEIKEEQKEIKEELEKEELEIVPEANPATTGIK